MSIHVGRVVVGVIVVGVVDYLVVALHVSWHFSGFALSLRGPRCMANMPGISDLKNSVIVYQVRYVVTHFTPLDVACMSKRAATFDMQRISAAMTGGTCRKRRPNLTCTRFSESGQRTQVYGLIPSISPCRCRQRKEAPVVFRPTTPYVGSGNAS